MIRILCVSVCCLSLLGCGGGGVATSPVSGTVTLDGQPLANVMVSFMPKEGGPAASSLTDASGKYSLVTAGKKGAVLGKHTVKVTSVVAPVGMAAGEMKSDSPEYKQKMMSGGGKKDYYKAQSSAMAIKEVIPEKYNTKSTLSHEVVSGSNTFDIAMTSK
jgi:hypothetical protein